LPDTFAAAALLAAGGLVSAVDLAGGFADDPGGEVFAGETFDVEDLAAGAGFVVVLAEDFGLETTAGGLVSLKTWSG
jgi:hypothetical protein